jgi:hypothetical protein
MNSIYRLFKTFVPKRLKKHLSRTIHNTFYEYSLEQWKKLPKCKLSNLHIKNLKVVSNRTDLLYFMPKEATVAEIGVDKGDYSELILQITNPQKLHLIDTWCIDASSSEEDQEGIWKPCPSCQKIFKASNNKHKIENHYCSRLNPLLKKFESYISSNLVEINQGISTEIVNSFDDNYFDWIYIDTSHTYENTKKELEMYSKKVKEFGIIAGHDFSIGDWNNFVRYGVIEAVIEFCVKNEWEIMFLSMEFIDGSPSFAIRRLIKPPL